jgi:glycosyltransferase involved in cell wall biosynthesis
VRIAVILSTYNAPERLEPTLLGYVAQHYRDFELIIADDGSTQATRELIRSITRCHDLAIRHVWQCDQGFRKCRILNQAILATPAEYLVFSDGDCVPRADFVATHARLAQRGRFLSGGYFKLNQTATRQITSDVILNGHATDPQWLLAHGIASSLKLRKLRAMGWQASLMNAITPTGATWNGHNASCWRQDALRVNGFDERMGYWAQDREFGERLVHAGIRGRQVRYSAVCVHLDHLRPYKTEASREKNKRIRRETRQRRARWTEHGIFKMLEPVHYAAVPSVAHDVVVESFRVPQGL